jgi:hypothetical protein
MLKVESRFNGTLPGGRQPAPIVAKLSGPASACQCGIATWEPNLGHAK